MLVFTKSIVKFCEHYTGIFMTTYLKCTIIYRGPRKVKLSF